MKDNDTKVVWFYLMAEVHNEYGDVVCTIPGLAKACDISVEKASSIIADFLAPDPYSGTPDFEGRRIEVIDRGWRLLNYSKYRKMELEEAKKTRDQLYAKIARLEKKLSENETVARSRSESQIVVSVAQSESYSDSESEREERKTGGEFKNTELQLKGLIVAWNDKHVLINKSQHVETWNNFKPRWDKANVDLGAFSEAVIRRLDRYDSDTSANKREYLGTLSNFLTKGYWKDEPGLEVHRPKAKIVNEPAPNLLPEIEV